MASMNFSSSKQFVRPPQRGIFPLDHDAECKAPMEAYLSCLQSNKDQHCQCRDLSKDYLQCRMDRQLMAKEDLNEVRRRRKVIFLDSFVDLVVVEISLEV